MEAITELINAGEFDTEMIEAKIHIQKRTNADHLPKPSNEITPNKNKQTNSFQLHSNKEKRKGL